MTTVTTEQPSPAATASNGHVQSGSFEYAPAPESTDHAQIRDSYGFFINGKFADPKSGRYFTTINPATEKPLAQIAEADSEDVNAAVQAARQAFVKWSKLP